MKEKLMQDLIINFPSEILYPEIGEFSPNGQQYACYNTVAKEFARQYSFGDSELDFIFQEIHKL